jgi:lysylphosphatidylglycerol synthetase-like protein (DUF2156 family)
LAKLLLFRSVTIAILTRFLIILARILVLFVVSYLISMLGYYLDSDAIRGDQSKVFLMKFGPLYTSIFITILVVALKFFSTLIEKRRSFFVPPNGDKENRQ